MDACQETPRKKNSKSNNFKSKESGTDKSNDLNTDSGSGQFEPGPGAPAPTEQNGNLGKEINSAICNANSWGSRFQILTENMDEDIVADCMPDNKEDDLDDEIAVAQDSNG